MSLKRWIRRLEREAEEEIVAIPQSDGTVKRFPQSDLMEAFLSGVDRATGKDVPDHPLSMAARNSSEAKWRESFYAGSEEIRPVVDLSEP